ncbi:MAG: BrnA antitoxin family protein [Steroidobacteraceae bacterium]
MSKAKRLVTAERPDTDNPAWTAKDFARARPAAEVLPASLMRKVRGPQKAPTKERITIRLSRDVLERFRAAGPGWQARIDRALRKISESNPRVTHA